MKRYILTIAMVVLSTTHGGLCGDRSQHDLQNPLKVALYTPLPEYPLAARERHFTGNGKFLMRIHVRTGLVADIRMLQSTGHAILDQAVVHALKQWRFKPNALTPAKLQNPKHTEPWAGDDSLILIPSRFTFEGAAVM
jgi:TonB family protein